MKEQVDIGATFVEWDPVGGLHFESGYGPDAQLLWIDPKDVPRLVEWLTEVTTRLPPS